MDFCEHNKYCRWSPPNGKQVISRESRHYLRGERALEDLHESQCQFKLHRILESHALFFRN